MVVEEVVLQLRRCLFVVVELRPLVQFDLIQPLIESVILPSLSLIFIILSLLCFFVEDLHTPLLTFQHTTAHLTRCAATGVGVQCHRVAYDGTSGSAGMRGRQKAQQHDDSKGQK